MLGLTYEEVASQLLVDPSTVWHVVQRFEEHGTVDSCYTHEGPPKTLTALDEFIILEAVTNRPAIYLCEIQRLVEQTTGTTISESAICRFLHKNTFSCKKLQRVARQRNEELRAQFSSNCSLYLLEHARVYRRNWERQTARNAQVWLQLSRQVSEHAY